MACTPKVYTYGHSAVQRHITGGSHDTAQHDGERRGVGADSLPTRAACRCCLLHINHNHNHKLGFKMAQYLDSRCVFASQHFACRGFQPKPVSNPV